jgi:hypothetical protein
MLRFWRLVVGASCVCLLTMCSLGQGGTTAIGTFVLDGRTYTWQSGMSQPWSLGEAYDGKPAGSVDLSEMDLQFSPSVEDLVNNVWIYLPHHTSTGVFSDCTFDLTLGGVLYIASGFTVRVDRIGNVGGRMEGSFSGDITMAGAPHHVTGSFSVVRAPDGTFVN